MPDLIKIQGETVPLQASFVDASGDPVNPSSVTLTIRKPDGTVVTPTPTNTATGQYSYDFDSTSQSVGRYRYEFVGVGTSLSVVTGPSYFEIRASLANDSDLVSTKTPVSGDEPYCTVDEFLLHVDKVFAGQLSVDDGTVLSESDLISNGTIYELLRRASGIIEAACLRGNLYEPADLVKMLNTGGNAAAYLRGLCADLTVGLLRDRRVFDDPTPLPSVARAYEVLEQLTRGQRIFPFAETQEAGRPTNRFLTEEDLQRVNLPTLESRYWGQRFRSGRWSY